MNLSSLSVRRGVAFGMVYLVVVAFGLLSLARLQLDLFPEMNFPTVVVVTGFEGASPEDIETLITDPLEGSLAGVERVEEVSSESRQGLSVVEVGFSWGTDMDAAETDVRRALDLVDGRLPDDADAPVVFTMDPALEPVIELSLKGPYPQDELRRLADDEVAPRLERLPGVASALVAGGLEREIQVQLDPERIEAFGLDPMTVTQAVYAENRQEPGGTVEQGQLDFTIHTRGQYASVPELGEVLVGVVPTATGTRPVQLRDVATVADTFADADQVIEVDGTPAITLSVRKQSGENTVQTVREVEGALADIEAAAGAGVQLEVLTSQADYIVDSIGNLASTALIAIVIAFVVLWLFLRDPRAAAVVSAAIPLSLVATFALMDTADMTLNILSTAGLALAVGMLVDNAVVVLESIVRYRQQGMNAWDAAIAGARSVGTAVTASTLTTLAVFIPVLFVPGFAGMLFQDMAITICFALAVSLVVAMSFVPLAASRLLGGQASVDAGAAADQGLMGRIRDGYSGALAWVLGRRWIVVGALVLALAVTAVLATRIPTEFIANGDRSELEVTVSAPMGTTLDETHTRTREVLAQVEQIVDADEQTHTVLEAGGGSGFAALFSAGDHESAITLTLVPIGERDRSQGEIERQVREALSKVPGVDVRVGPRFNPMGGEGDLAVEIRGHDLATARELGDALRDDLLALPQVSEVAFSLEEQAPQVQVEFDRARLAHLGLSSASVGQAISTAFQGRSAGLYTDGGDQADIRVRYDEEHRTDLDELRRLPLVTPSGETVRLDSVAEVSETLAPSAISRLDQARTTTMTVYLADEYLAADGRVMAKDVGGSIGAVDEVLAAAAWPEGFDYVIAGSADDFTESFAMLGLALLAAIVLVYMVMAGQFESFRLPLVILFTVPLALMGVVWMLALTGSALDVSSLIGVIMLVGIVVNNGIVMVDAANQLQLKGRTRLQAIVEASRLRLRPVLLTSLTTILCMVPLALEIGAGAEQWSGMARAVIGGMSVATVLTLFVVPTVFTAFARKDEPAAGTAGEPVAEAA
jgi:hydrophobic/amphiphilic exporter-1 (mainly G- bacteria), HAE1 family